MGKTYGKPTLRKIEEKANDLYKYLFAQESYVTKEQIGVVLGIKNERSVRDVISLLATKKPIISKSNSTGYKLAKTVADLEEVENCWRELSSRIIELETRIIPLLEFREKILKNY